MVNDHVKANGPFCPLKLFEYVTQSFYLKTKEGGDSPAQQMSMLCISFSYRARKQNMVTQVLKTVIVIAFISWGIIQRCDLLQRFEIFKYLNGFRNALNKSQATSVFMLSASLDLFWHAKLMRTSKSSITKDGLVSP